MFALAEQQRRASEKAFASGDAVAGGLLAEQAEATYLRTVALARAATAQAALDEATTLARRSEDQRRDISVERQRSDDEASALEKRVLVERELQAPPPSGPASPQREAARAVAARALATEGRLLCGAARLLGAKSDELDGAEKEAKTLDERLERSKGPSPIDAAARFRATCLRALTLARRNAPDKVSGQADTLLAKLSEAHWSPTRDERGVVVTLRGPFVQSDQLHAGFKEKLRDLGKLGKEGGNTSLQLVLHQGSRDGNPVPKAEALLAFLVEGGWDRQRLSVENAGTRLPLVDHPAGVTDDRNGRVDVVFVTHQP
jgi:flagellar motor protein MotB